VRSAVLVQITSYTEYLFLDEVVLFLDEYSPPWLFLDEITLFLDEIPVLFLVQSQSIFRRTCTLRTLHLLT